MNEIPKVGQTVYALNIGNNARRRPQMLTPVTVISVGRKYFKCKAENSWVETEYRIESGLEHTAFSPGSKIYESQEEWEKEKRSYELHTKLSQFFQFGGGSRNLCLEQLESISSIIDGCHKNI